MSNQPEALRLADVLDAHQFDEPHAAAAELRRQHAEIEALKAERDALRAQLPEGMKECTITFSQCERGHGQLSAANWVQHPCMVCERNALRAALKQAVARQGFTNDELISARAIIANATGDNK